LREENNPWEGKRDSLSDRREKRDRWAAVDPPKKGRGVLLKGMEERDTRPFRRSLRLPEQTPPTSLPLGKEDFLGSPKSSAAEVIEGTEKRPRKGAFLKRHRG